MTRNVEELFGGVITAPHQIPFTYKSNVGGETFLSLPFYPVTGVVTINGGMQVPLDNFEIEGNTLNLGRALSKGDVVYCLFDKILSPEERGLVYQNVNNDASSVGIYVNTGSLLFFRAKYNSDADAISALVLADADADTIKIISQTTTSGVDVLQTGAGAPGDGTIRISKSGGAITLANYTGSAMILTFTQTTV
ncbi:tail fiber protein [Salmonella phage Mansal]|nr:tail fiber protein [Salmonella phage Mansal]